MQGDNELHLNETTMKVALQYYFTNVLFATGQAPVVKSVEENKSGNDFRVIVSDQQP